MYVDERVKDMRHSISDLYDNISNIKNDTLIPPVSVKNLDVAVNTRDGNYIYSVNFDHPMDCTFCISFDDITVTSNTNTYVYKSEVKVNIIHVVSVNSAGKSSAESIVPREIQRQIHNVKYHDGRIIATHDYIPNKCKLILFNDAGDLSRTKCYGERTEVKINFVTDRLGLTITKNGEKYSNDIFIDIPHLDMRFTLTKYLRVSGSTISSNNRKIFNNLSLTGIGEDDIKYDCNSYYSIRSKSPGNVIRMIPYNDCYLLELNVCINKLSVVSDSTGTIFISHINSSY